MSEIYVKLFTKKILKEQAVTILIRIRIKQCSIFIETFTWKVKWDIKHKKINNAKTALSRMLKINVVSENSLRIKPIKHGLTYIAARSLNYSKKFAGFHKMFPRISSPSDILPWLLKSMFTSFTSARFILICAVLEHKSLPSHQDSQYQLRVYSH